MFQRWSSRPASRAGSWSTKSTVPPAATRSPTAASTSARAAWSSPVHASSSTSRPGEGSSAWATAIFWHMPLDMDRSDWSAYPAAPRRSSHPSTRRRPSWPRSPCTRARCIRYSRPENGRPPGNRSGTYAGVRPPGDLPRRRQRHAGDDPQQGGLPRPVAAGRRGSAVPRAGRRVTPRTTQGWRIPYLLPTASSRMTNLHAKRSDQRHHRKGWRIDMTPRGPTLGMSRNGATPAANPRKTAAYAAGQ